MIAQAAEFVKGKAGAAFGGQTPVKRKGLAPGTVKMVVGGVMAGMFALGIIAQLATFVESLRYGFFFHCSRMSVKAASAFAADAPFTVTRNGSGE